MATINRILDTEMQNKDSIHLFREGLFLKAYQHSAYQFFTHVRQFRAVKKHFKAVSADIVMLGFPSGRLKELFPEKEIEYIDGESHVKISCPPLDFRAFMEWYESVEMLPEKEKPEPKAPETQKEQIALPRGETLSSPVKHYGLLKKLQEYSLENATPMDCMLFIRDLKIELKENGGI